MKYFKKLNVLSKTPIIMAKVMEDVTLTVESNQIDFVELPNDNYGNSYFFIKEGYEETTRQEFDDFFISTVGKINELSKI